MGFDCFEHCLDCRNRRPFAPPDEQAPARTLGSSSRISRSIMDWARGSAATEGSTPTPRPQAIMRHMASKLFTWMRKRIGLARALSGGGHEAHERTLALLPNEVELQSLGEGHGVALRERMLLRNEQHEVVHVADAGDKSKGSGVLAEDSEIRRAACDRLRRGVA